MKQRFLMIVLAACCTLLPACKANTPSETGSQNTATIATEVSTQQAILLDVRTADEYANGHVAQAILVPHDSIAEKIASISPKKDQKIYVYCRSGRRSGIATQTLKSMGYTHVTDLGGLGNLGQYGLTIQ